MNIQREIIKMRLFSVLGTIFTIMTIIGAIYFFINRGKSPVWDSVVPMLLAATFNILSIKSAKRIKEDEK